jgi:multisubunit Na+/H+ antiporter MnhF subunit
MNRWEIAGLVIIAALLPCVGVAAFASAAAALAAVEVAGVLTVTALMVLSEGFHRQPFIDLAVVMALVSIVGSLTFARMMERDP